jgi:hypothetical protein
VGFKISEALLNLHPLSIEVYDEAGLQEVSVCHWNQQIPGFLIGWIVIYDHVHGDFPLGVIEDILVPKRFSERSVKMTESHPFPLIGDDRLLPSTDNIGPLFLLTLLEQKGASIGPVSDPDGPDPCRKSSFGIQKKDMLQLILTFECGFGEGVSESVTR